MTSTPRVRRDKPVANTSLAEWNGKLWALWEAHRPFVLDPVTLDTFGEETLGAFDFPTCPETFNTRINVHVQCIFAVNRVNQSMRCSFWILRPNSCWCLVADGALREKQAFCAHPKLDAGTGRLCAFSLGLRAAEGAPSTMPLSDSSPPSIDEDVPRCAAASISELHSSASPVTAPHLVQASCTSWR